MKRFSVDLDSLKLEEPPLPAKPSTETTNLLACCHHPVARHHDWHRIPPESLADGLCSAGLSYLAS